MFVQLTLTENLELTLRVLLWVMHVEEQREGGADRLFAAATQTTVLHFTSKQFPDHRLTGGAQRTGIKIDLFLEQCRLIDPGTRTHPLTCCWPPCRPVAPPVPASPGEAGSG